METSGGGGVVGGGCGAVVPSWWTCGGFDVDLETMCVRQTCRWWWCFCGGGDVVARDVVVVVMTWHLTHAFFPEVAAMHLITTGAITLRPCTCEQGPQAHALVAWTKITKKIHVVNVDPEHQDITRTGPEELADVQDVQTHVATQAGLVHTLMRHHSSERLPSARI